MDPANPKPFTQPFLVLAFDKADRSHMTWAIDVGGKIDEYIANFQKFYQGLLKTLEEDPRQRKMGSMEVTNFRSQATPRLEEILAKLATYNLRVDLVTAYVGSGGPSHVLMNGALFERIYLDNLRCEQSRHPYNYQDVAPFYDEICQKA
jgi:hypothetical protein